MTKIQWCNETANPIAATINGRRGWHCEKISPGCKFCYAETWNKTARFNLGTSLPYHKNSAVEMKFDNRMVSSWTRARKSRSIFVCSMTDWCGEFVKMDWRLKMLEAARRSKRTFYFITKRTRQLQETLRMWQLVHRIHTWPDNVWIGFSAENQKWFDSRWNYITDSCLDRFEDVNVMVSCEPLLDSIVLPSNFLAGGGRRWIIGGGETGPRARLCRAEWLVSLAVQCAANGVGFFFKATGDNAHGDYADVASIRQSPSVPSSWPPVRAVDAKGEHHGNL
jgi:protein gp37